MTKYEHFTVKQNELYDLLHAAEHSVSLAAHVMEADGTYRAISDYEKALDYAADIRRQIGENHDAHMAARSSDAGLKIKSEDFCTEDNKVLFSIAGAYHKHEEAALYGKLAA